MLSIIIPTLNEEKYLPLLLKEIKKQRVNGDHEIIVADAGSTDKTVEIAKNFNCKVVKGGSVAKGRNEGAKAAQGNIFLFTDADNIYLPENFLNNLLEEFEKRKLDVVSFPIYPVRNIISNGVDPQGRRIDIHKFDRFAYGVYNFWVNFSQRFSAYATNSILVKRELHQKIGGFDEEIKIAEDHFYAKTAKKLGKFGFIKTAPVLTSTRRFKKDGRLKTYLKYLTAGIYMFFFGPIKKDIFRYRAGGASEVNSKK